MQHKKTLLRRLLVIYLLFFGVLITGIAHGLLPGFAKGFTEGMRISSDIVENWESGTPRLIYRLPGIPVRPEAPQRLASADAGVLSLDAQASTLDLTVGESGAGLSMAGIAFRSVGGSAWFYALTLFILFAVAAIVALMILIIRSLRRSIREERPLDRRNVRMLRTIGVLTILAELAQDFVNWRMAGRAAELLAGSGYAVQTGFGISYTNLIMGILVLFAAEVFAIGQNLSEEQKLTI